MCSNYFDLLFLKTSLNFPLKLFLSSTTIHQTATATESYTRKSHKGVVTKKIEKKLSLHYAYAFQLFNSEVFNAKMIITSILKRM